MNYNYCRKRACSNYNTYITSIFCNSYDVFGKKCFWSAVSNLKRPLRCTWWPIIQSDLLGIPDTSLSGRSTLTARSVLRSNSDPAVDKILQWNSRTWVRLFIYITLIDQVILTEKKLLFKASTHTYTSPPSQTFLTPLRPKNYERDACYCCYIMCFTRLSCAFWGWICAFAQLLIQCLPSL